MNKTREKKSKKQNKKTKSSIPFHYDDKGRRIFDFNKIDTLEEKPDEKQEMIKKRYENRDKNLNSETNIYKCDKCNLTFTSNVTYIEHLNGKKHNMVIGNKLAVKQSSLESVREKLLTRKRERDEIKNNTKKSTE